MGKTDEEADRDFVGAVRRVRLVDVLLLVIATICFLVGVAIVCAAPFLYPGLAGLIPCLIAASFYIGVGVVLLGIGAAFRLLGSIAIDVKQIMEDHDQ